MLRRLASPVQASPEMTSDHSRPTNHSCTNSGTRLVVTAQYWGECPPKSGPYTEGDRLPLTLPPNMRQTAITLRKSPESQDIVRGGTPDRSLVRCLHARTRSPGETLHLDSPLTTLGYRWPKVTRGFSGPCRDGTTVVAGSRLDHPKRLEDPTSLLGEGCAPVLGGRPPGPPTLTVGGQGPSRDGYELLSILGADTLLSIATKLSARSLANDCGSGPRPASREVIRSDGPDPYRVLLFGGGPAVGYGVLSHDLALAGNLARGLTEATGHGIDIDVVVQVDLRCREVPTLLAEVDLDQFDIVVFSVGIQDVLDFRPLDESSAAVEKVLNLLRAGAQRMLPVSVIAAPAASNVLQLEPMLARAADQRAAEFNIRLKKLCDTRRDLTFVPFEHEGETVPCRERAFADYRRWASSMVAVIAPTFELVHEHAHPAQREDARQAAVDRLDLTAVPQDMFDSITRSARRMLGTLGAGMTIIDHDQQRFTSSTGDGFPVIPRRHGLCDYAIHTNHGFVVTDALLDPRLADSYFTQTAKLRSYAGIPIRDPSGHMIGALCVYDDKPRQFTTTQLIRLRALAHLLENELRAAV